MAEANRAERHAWVERCAAAARNPEPHRYLSKRDADNQVFKGDTCPGLLGDVFFALFNPCYLKSEPGRRGLYYL